MTGCCGAEAFPRDADRRHELGYAAGRSQAAAVGVC